MNSMSEAWSSANEKVVAQATETERLKALGDEIEASLADAKEANRKAAEQPSEALGRSASAQRWRTFRRYAGYAGAVAATVAVGVVAYRYFRAAPAEVVEVAMDSVASTTEVL